MTDTLLKLAERVEQAEGPDCDLDHAIHDLLGDNDGAPAYTRSLDAAMKLVPEGCEYSLGSGRRKAGNPEHVSPWARVFLSEDAVCSQIGLAATPALALCAAALRARDVG